MSTAIQGPTISFPEGYDARREYETPMRGYLSDVVVQMEDGVRYRLYFIDPVRVQQTLEDETSSGRSYFTEPGLVILPEVTTEEIKKAVGGLIKDGFFTQLKPL